MLLVAAAAAAAAPRASDDRLPASLLLGKSSTEVSRAFSICRTHHPSPLVKACEATVGEHRAAALFLVDSAQLVEQVDVAFPLQKVRAAALAQVGALRALAGGFSASRPTADRRRQIWEVVAPQRSGEVRLQASVGGWMVSGTFRDPTFKPSYF